MLIAALVLFALLAIAIAHIVAVTILLRFLRGELEAARAGREAAQLAGLQALGAAEERAAAERAVLLERIQRPEVVPYVVAPDDEQMSFLADEEGDEIRRAREQREARATEIDLHLAETFGRADEVGLG